MMIYLKKTFTELYSPPTRFVQLSHLIYHIFHHKHFRKFIIFYHWNVILEPFCHIDETSQSTKTKKYYLYCVILPGHHWNMAFLAHFRAQKWGFLSLDTNHCKKLIWKQYHAIPFVSLNELICSFFFFLRDFWKITEKGIFGVAGHLNWQSNIIGDVNFNIFTQSTLEIMRFPLIPILMNLWKNSFYNLS